MCDNDRGEVQYLLQCINRVFFFFYVYNFNEFGEFQQLPTVQPE